MAQVDRGAQAVHGAGAGPLAGAVPQGLPLRNSNFMRRYYAPARHLAATSVSRAQVALGITETRRGRAVFGEVTGAALATFQRDQGLEKSAVIGPEDWWALASQLGVADGQRDLLLRSVGVGLTIGDMDFRPPVFHDLRHTAVSLYLSVTRM